jgi:hypothetical protein
MARRPDRGARNANRSIRRAAFAGLAPLLAVGAVAVSVVRDAPSEPSASATVTVTVDFSRAVGSHSVVGFLHGLSEREPAGRWIGPLQPALWRGDLSSASYARATAMGARYMLVVSDLWGYPGEIVRWRGRQAPWSDLGAGRSFVRELARSNRHRELIWDIWNEPDNPYFWDGTRAQYLSTCEAAYEAIRSVLGRGARVAGPSVSAFRWRWLADMVAHCRRVGCEVNALTWHELPLGRSPISAIKSHLRRARSRLVGNPANAAVRIRELMVNEVVAGGDQLQPGEQAAYLYYLERGGADAAARACWRDPCGADNCSNASLDGLLDPLTLRPRAAWWVVRSYSQGVHTRVWSRSTSAWVVALAARRAKDIRQPEILLGYFDPHTAAAPARVDIRVVLHGLRRVPALRGAGAVRVRFDRIADAGEAPAAPAPCELPRLIRVRNDGTGAFTVRGLGLHEAMLLTLTRATSPIGG